MIAKKTAEWKPEKSESENENMYRIVGIIAGHYIVKTCKGLKKTEGPGLSSGAIQSNKKNDYVFFLIIDLSSHTHHRENLLRFSFGDEEP